MLKSFMWTLVSETLTALDSIEYLFKRRTNGAN